MYLIRAVLSSEPEDNNVQHFETVKYKCEGITLYKETCLMQNNALSHSLQQFYLPLKLCCTALTCHSMVWATTDLMQAPAKDEIIHLLTDTNAGVFTDPSKIPTPFQTLTSLCLIEWVEPSYKLCFAAVPFAVIFTDVMRENAKGSMLPQARGQLEQARNTQPGRVKENGPYNEVP